jgi:hypothetical protein
MDFTTVHMEACTVLSEMHESWGVAQMGQNVASYLSYKHPITSGATLAR